MATTTERLVVIFSPGMPLKPDGCPVIIGRGSVGSDKSTVRFGPLLTIVALGAQFGTVARPKTLEPVQVV